MSNKTTASVNQLFKCKLYIHHQGTILIPCCEQLDEFIKCSYQKMRLNNTNIKTFNLCLTNKNSRSYSSFAFFGRVFNPLLWKHWASPFLLIPTLCHSPFLRIFFHPPPFLEKIFPGIPRPNVFCTPNYAFSFEAVHIHHHMYRSSFSFITVRNHHHKCSSSCSRGSIRKQRASGKTRLRELWRNLS